METRNDILDEVDEAMELLSQHFTSTEETMQAMKEMFRNVIQQVIEVEMDEELGLERYQRSQMPENEPWNYRNGYSR